MAVWLQAIVTLAPTAQCRQLAHWLAHDGRKRLRSSGGHIWGLWDGRSGMGFSPGEAILMSVWPDDASAGAAVELMKTLPQVIAVNGTPLHPILPHKYPRPVSGSGVWVFRDFHLTTTELHDFLDRSAAAFEAPETASDSEVVGLFRCPDEDAETAALLSITRYADHDAWEARRNENSASGNIEQLGEANAPSRWSRTRSAILQPLPDEP